MSDEIEFRQPTVEDAAPLWRLIGELEGLEQNTCYCYLLLCSHFATSSVVATRADEIVGFVLGYRPPTRQNAMFVWQVAVHRAPRLPRLSIPRSHCRDQQPRLAGAVSRVRTRPRSVV